MKILSSVVLKEVNDDLIFALSLEVESEEFFRFESVSARVLKYAYSSKEFTRDDLIKYVLEQYPEVLEKQASKDVDELCQFLLENRFFS